MMIFDELQKRFEASANPDKARQMAAYMKNQFVYYGIQTPQRRALYKDLIATERRSKVIDWNLLEICWQAPQREYQYFVGDYLRAMKNYLSFDDIPKLENFVRNRQWWDSIDFLDQIIGNIGLTDRRVDDLMRSWARDDNFWVRRLAIEHQLGRKSQTNTKLLEEILLANFGSQEFFINKAIGWALRDYSKTNPEWVRSFFQKYRKDLAPLSVKEGSKYI